MDEKRRVISSLVWKFAERMGAQGVTFVVSIILARILDPTVYGTLALVSVFMVILGVFVDSGFGNALIQKKDADDLDYSTVFYFNIATSILLYIFMYVSAPFIATFYENSELTWLIRALSLNLVIGGIKGIQCAYVSKNMLFKKFFFSTLGGTIVAAVVGIVMAYNGYGAWALVCQGLANNVIDTLILWLTVEWRPKMMFSINRLKTLFSFGWKLLLSALLDTGYSQLRQLIIGKKYTEADLAYYNQGGAYPSTVVTNINASIDSVLLPTLSNAQDSVEDVKNMTRRAIKTSVYVMAPMMIGLAVIAEPLVTLLLTEKWLPCVFYMRIFCITYMFWPIHTANLNAIKALGRSDLFLKLEIIKKLIGLAVLLSTMWFGVRVMACSLLFISVASQIINSWPNKKLLGYGYLSQLIDILPSMAIALIMGVFVLMIGYINCYLVLSVAMQIIIGAVFYWGISKLIRLEPYVFLENLIFHRNKN